MTLWSWSVMFVLRASSDHFSLSREKKYDWESTPPPELHSVSNAPPSLRFIVSSLSCMCAKLIARLPSSEPFITLVYIILFNYRRCSNYSVFTSQLRLEEKLKLNTESTFLCLQAMCLWAMPQWLIIENSLLNQWHLPVSVLQACNSFNPHAPEPIAEVTWWETACNCGLIKCRQIASTLQSVMQSSLCWWVQLVAWEDSTLQS